MRTAARVGILILALAAGLRAQEQPAAEDDVLWMPEGYRLLSLEERNALPPEEMKEIGTRNTALLREAARAMTPEERQEMARRLGQYGRTHPLADFQRQYVAMATMLLLGATEGEKAEKWKADDRNRFEKLLQDQEGSATKGFRGDADAVTREGQEITDEASRGDRRVLYLRTLRALRAQPFNTWVRWALRRVVGGDSSTRNGEETSLYAASLAFFHAREAGTPAEGAWFSIEAVFRLRFRGEVPEARKLFALANAKGSQDDDAVAIPLLLAEVEGDKAEQEQLLPRARERWPKPNDLDRMLYTNLGVLPEALQVRARDAFEHRYKGSHPADWVSRYGILFDQLESGRFAEVENETAAVLSLSFTTLPEPHRSALLSLSLRAKAGLGKCDEVAAELPRLEAALHQAYPPGSDPQAPPPRRRPDEVRELRDGLPDEREALRKLKAAFADGSLENAPAWGDTTREERHQEVAEWIEEGEKEVAAMEAMLRNRDDAEVAAEWTRQELAAWRERRGIPENAQYDILDKAEYLTAAVRTAVGRCFLGRGRPAEAARLLTPCARNGENFHNECVEPLLEAGHALVAQRRIAEAAAIYTLVAPSESWGVRVNDLYWDIEKASPGTVRKFEPTPRPTPKVPPQTTVRRPEA